MQPYLYNAYDFRFQFYRLFSMRRWLEFMNDVHDCDYSIIFHGNHLLLLWFHNIRFIHMNLVLGHGDTEKTPIFPVLSLRSSHW